MNEQEIQDQLAGILRDALERHVGICATRVSRVALTTHLQRAAERLRREGLVSSASVEKIEAFEDLPEADRARIEKLNEDLEYLGLAGADGRILLPLLKASSDDLRWILWLDPDVPPEAQAQLREQARVDGCVDWDRYRELVEEHPDRYEAVRLRSPRGMVLVDWNFTPTYPLRTITLKATIE